MRWTALLPPALFVGGAASIGLAVVDGTAHAAIVVVFPVVYGSSLLFLAGIVLVVAGMFALPLAFPGSPDQPSTGAPPATGASGGFVLIGPVPIFWGGAAGVSRTVRIAAAVAGGVVLAVAVLVLIGWRG